MLSDAMVIPTIPVTDLDRALPFYRDVLGLAVLEQTPFAIRFGAGEGSQLSVYKRPPVERGQTVAHFEVADIEAEMAEIRSRGGVFEEYSSPGLTTVNGIAPIGPHAGRGSRTRTATSSACARARSPAASAASAEAVCPAGVSGNRDSPVARGCARRNDPH